MTTANDLQTENKRLRAELTAVRGLLPKANLPDPDQWHTMTEVAEELDLSELEAQEFCRGAEIVRDGRGRDCVSRADLDAKLVEMQRGEHPALQLARAQRQAGAKNIL